MAARLHTPHTEVRRYANVARDLLEQLSEQVERLTRNNDEEEISRRQHNAGEVAGHDYFDARDQLRAARLEETSWDQHTTQLLRDALYLLAVGDTGPTQAAELDPHGASKQAHYERRVKARERLEEQGWLTDQ